MTISLHQFVVYSLSKILTFTGGIITKADLAKYKPIIRSSAKVRIERPEPLTLHTVPPPGNGLILTLILNILSNYNMTGDDFKDIDRAVLMYHRITEAFKFAFAHRNQLLDPEFGNITQVIIYLSKYILNSLYFKWHLFNG